MSASVANLIRFAELQQTLASLPQVASSPERPWITGWAVLDEHGPLRGAAIAELCSSPALGGLFLHQMLGTLRQNHSFAGLINCGRTFDPGSHQEAALNRLLCVLCETGEQGVKAADLLLRDGNLPLVLLDLQALPLRSLGRIPVSTWHRFQRLVEKSGTVFVVMTPQPIAEGARMRIALRGQWSLQDLRRRRDELIAALEVRVFHRGRDMESVAEFSERTA